MERTRREESLSFKEKWDGFSRCPCRETAVGIS